ncbi:hypothetical protein IV203_012924 [Nitzschia inconspicua]|uniref:Uncharacterized protein n=1 Tax=Nitzschia inconspicua TaxID=303405 RepID=A0A9K3Q9U3_9STRA|nr:hypothetical protein IV203_012924 [Nitzschia inconspicua]
MAESLKQDFIQQIAKRAKLDDNGTTTPCHESKWEEWATPIATLYLSSRRGTHETLSENDVKGCSTAVLQCNASEYQKNVVSKPVISNQYRRIIPAVCPLSASQMEQPSNASQQRQLYFEHTLVTDTTHYGAFVSVQSYTQLCVRMISENFEFLIELGAFGSNTNDTIYAQFPLVPKTKGSEQDADIAIVVRRNDKDNRAGSAVADFLEYKPTYEFSGFYTQASVYGKDAMNISNLPCVVIQVCGWGPWILSRDPFKDIDGLKLLISVLKDYLEAFVQEQPNAWHHGYFSNVVSKHPLNGVEHVYKAYGYRLRTRIPIQDQRQPNIDIVKNYVDANAIRESPQEHFHIVCTKFFPRDDGGPWYGPVPAFKFASIIRQLKQLHEEDGMVHGDVRLRNMIVHEGVLTDFDWTRTAGSLYPSTLLDVTGDGKRPRKQSKYNAVSNMTIVETRNRSFALSQEPKELKSLK